MAQNPGYYPQPQQQYTYPQSHRPQNIYQQLGKPQPQPHLQSPQQLPTLQTSFPLRQAPYASSHTPYPSQLSQTPVTPHVSPHPQSQTPYISSQPQSQTSYSSQTPYQHSQYLAQQQPQSYSSQSQRSYISQTPLASQTPVAVPTSSSGSSWRVPASWPPPAALSATLAQQAQPQVQAQVQPQTTFQTPTQTSVRRPLPQPSPGANAKTPSLPFASQPTDTPSSGSNRPFPTAIQLAVGPVLNPPSPTRARPLPTPSSHSPAKNSPIKENAPSLSLNKSSGLPTVVSTIPKSISTTSSSTSTTSATSANSTSTLASPPKKFTPIWKHTLPDYPAPAWGYAVGMISEPHPKPKAQVPTQPTPAVAPPPSVPAVSLTKSVTPYQQSVQSGSTNFVQSALRQPQPHKYQRQQQAYYGNERTPAVNAEIQDHEEDSEEETDSEDDDNDDDDDDDDDDEESDPRYNPQNERQKYTRLMADIPGKAGVPNRGLTKGKYEQNFVEVISTPKRKHRMKQKAKMDSSMDVNTTNGHKSRVMPGRGRKNPYSQEKDITPKAAKTIQKSKNYVLSEEDVGFEAVNCQMAYFRETSDDDGRERKQFQDHGRSRSAYEGRGKEAAVAKQRRQLDKERKAGSAFSVDERNMRRRQGEDDRKVRLAYDDDEEEEEEEEEEAEDTKMRGRRPVLKNGTPRKNPERSQGLRSQGSSPQWDVRDLPTNLRAGPALRYGNSYENSEEEEDPRYCRVPEIEKEWSPILKLTNRRGLPQPPAGAGVSEKSMKGGPRWKSTPPKYDNYGRRKLYHPQEEMTKFAALAMSANRTSLVDNQASAGGWPVDLPRLPRTPGSSSASSSITTDCGSYFDIRPQPVTVTSSAFEFSGKQQLRSAGISGKMNISLDDPPPRATAIQSASPSTSILISRRVPLSQLPQPPESQTSNTSGTDSQIVERLQHRRSLYSALGTVPLREEEGLKKRPQSQTYGSGTAQMQAPIGSRDQHQRHQFSSHPPFLNQVMHNSIHYRPQPAAPPPTIGIESPHPVGGRDKLADIPMLEEESNNESEGEHHPGQRSNHKHVQVPRINVASDPSSPPLPRIQVDGAGSGSSVPMISIQSPPRTTSINNGGEPTINIEPPRINVNGGDSPRNWKQPATNSSGVQVYEIPGVSVSDGHFQSVSQQSEFGGQQSHGGQARPGGGLACGGCNGSIIGHIVSAMGSRWHPACFRCTVCKELLEHVSSYEHEGRPYCHLDYHENFAPKCYSCKTAIIEEQFISLDDPALGKRTYHTQHFFCAECGDPFLSPSVSFPDSQGEVALSGDGEFEGFAVYKGHPYCEACHVRLRLPKCKRCKRSIRDHDVAVEALGGKWCWGCFVCASCDKPFEDPSFFQRDDKPYCERCFSIMLRNEV